VKQLLTTQYIGRIAMKVERGLWGRATIGDGYKEMNILKWNLLNGAISRGLSHIQVDMQKIWKNLFKIKYTISHLYF